MKGLVSKQTAVTRWREMKKENFVPNEFTTVKFPQWNDNNADASVPG